MRGPFYGWYDQNRQEWRLSKRPPDDPVRPSTSFETRPELMAYAKRMRREVLWFPRLTPEQERLGSMMDL